MYFLSPWPTRSRPHRFEFFQNQNLSPSASTACYEDETNSRFTQDRNGNSKQKSSSNIKIKTIDTAESWGKSCGDEQLAPLRLYNNSSDCGSVSGYIHLDLVARENENNNKQIHA